MRVPGRENEGSFAVTITAATLRTCTSVGLMRMPMRPSMPLIDCAVKNTRSVSPVPDEADDQSVPVEHVLAHALDVDQLLDPHRRAERGADAHRASGAEISSARQSLFIGTLPRAAMEE